VTQQVGRPQRPADTLIIESDAQAEPRNLEDVERACADACATRSVVGFEEAVVLCERDRFDTVILCLGAGMPNPSHHVRKIAVRQSHAAIIVVTDRASLAHALDIMRAGAADVLIRPFSAKQMQKSLALAAPATADRAPSLAPQVAEAADGPGGMIGRCEAMSALYQRLEQAAASRATVFLLGESGTGKELCAEAVHEMSARSAKPMISLNCSAIPRELMESEIFGHEKGAFTGAHEARPGAAERADGGTLFLDEICEMDLALQAKLLRFIQTGRFTRVGGTRELDVDVRFVCATNKDPVQCVQRGQFRADLYYRLHVLPVSLPPLRERGDDILSIARSALATCAAEEGKRFTAFADDVEDMLRAYDWPGNVRELLNVVRNIVVMNDGETVETDMVPLPAAAPDGAYTPHGAVMAFAAAEAQSMPGGRAAPAGREILRPLWQQEQEIIERAIALCGGNIGTAAAHLDISPSTIYRKRHLWTQAGAA